MSRKRIVLETSTGKLSLAHGTTTIGRSRSCGIRLEDLSASRNHALISRDGDRVTVKDLDSSNGTFLNGERLEQEVELRHGDVITIGESELRLALIDEVTDPGSATVYAGGDLSTRHLPNPASSPARLTRPSSSEAVAVGDALPVGEVLAQSQPAWKSTGVLPMPVAPVIPRPPSAPLLAPNPILPGESPESGELLPSIDDIERQLAAQERQAKPSQSPRSATSRLQPAGFFRRFFAQLIDTGLAMVVATGASFAAGGPLDPTGGLVLSLSSLLLLLGFHVGGWILGGASPGKRLLGLVVCDDKGRVGLSFGRALLRYLGYMVSGIPLGAGYLIPLFHPQKKALHDLIAGTFVARR